MQNLRNLQNMRSMQGKGGLIAFNPLSLSQTTQWLFKEPNTSTQAVDTIGAETRPIRKPRCYDFSVASSSIKATAPSGDIHSVSAINMAGGIVDGSVSYASGVHTITFTEKVYNIKLWATGTVTDAQKKAVTLEGSGGQSELYAWHVGQEESGAVAFDISGNGNHSNIQSSSLVDFHAIDKDVCKSWANDVGYTKQILSSQTYVLDDSRYNDLPVETINLGTNYEIEFTATRSGSVEELIFGENGGEYGIYVSTSNTIYHAGSGAANWSGLTIPTSSTTYKITKSGTTVELFLDGVSQGAKTLLSNNDFSFSQFNGVAGDWHWNGTVSNVSVKKDGVLQDINLKQVIPRNEAIPTQDVLGNPLQYTGRVKYNNDIVASPCGNFDGAVDKITFSDLTGVSITSYQGTATPTIVGNEILCTAGTLYNLVLSNGWHFPFTEKSGLTIHNKADINNPGQLVTSDEDAFWSQKQDVYHDYLLNGGSEYSDVKQGTNVITPSTTIDFTTIVFEAAAIADSNLQGISFGLSGGHYFMFSGVNGIFGGRASLYTPSRSDFGSGVLFDTKKARKYILQRNANNTFSFYEDNVLIGTSTNTSTKTLDIIGAGYANGSGAYMRNFRVYNKILSSSERTEIQNGERVSDGLILEYLGTGETPWQDTVGGNHATASGQKSKYVSASSDTKDCLDNHIGFPAGNHWNYPPSKLLAPEAPALTCPFVHGGTFDGNTHELNSSYTPSQDVFYVSYIFSNSVTNSNELHVGFYSNTSDVYNLYYWGGQTERWFGFNTWSNDSYGFDGRGIVDDNKDHLVVAKFVFGDHTQGKIWIDGVEQSLSQVRGITDTKTRGSQVLSFSKEPSFPGQKFQGRVSVLKVYSQTLTNSQEEALSKGGAVPSLDPDFEEILNGSLTNLTLTGSEDTFWVKEHNNLMFDSSGNAIPYDPADINGNYLGLNRIFSDKSNPKKLDNIIVLDEPATGTDLQKILKYTNQ